jgi:phosphoribosyl-dephospho-CoA transferase
LREKELKALKNTQQVASLEKMLELVEKNKNSLTVNFKKIKKILISLIVIIPGPFKTKILSQEILVKKTEIKVIKGKIKPQTGETKTISQSKCLSKKTSRSELK